MHNLLGAFNLRTDSKALQRRKLVMATVVMVSVEIASLLNALHKEAVWIKTPSQKTTNGGYRSF